MKMELNSWLIQLAELWFPLLRFRVRILFKICKDLGYLTYSQLYDACVSPIVNYAAGVWGFKERRISDAVQNRAIHCFLGIPKYVPSLAAQGDMGWIPGTIRRKCDMFRVWNRFVNINKINKKVFLWSKVQNSSWAAEINAVFEDVFFSICIEIIYHAA